MTTRDFLKLAPGDTVVNRRAPGIVLTVSATADRSVNGLMTRVADMTNSQGLHQVPEGRAKEFVRLLEQTRMPL